MPSLALASSSAGTGLHNHSACSLQVLRRSCLFAATEMPASGVAVPICPCFQSSTNATFLDVESQQGSLRGETLSLSFSLKSHSIKRGIVCMEPVRTPLSPKRPRISAATPKRKKVFGRTGQRPAGAVGRSFQFLVQALQVVHGAHPLDAHGSCSGCFLGCILCQNRSPAAGPVLLIQPLPPTPRPALAVSLPSKKKSGC